MTPAGSTPAGAARNRASNTVDETAIRHGAGVEEETDDAAVAYARFPEPELTRYRDGWLPSS